MPAAQTFLIIMTIDEFQKTELKIGKIISAEKVEGSEKLLKLQVDLGSEQRQVLSGIGKGYQPEELTGKQVVLVTNLEPRVIMGMESQGMILAAHGDGGVPVVLQPEKEVPPGGSIT